MSENFETSWKKEFGLHPDMHFDASTNPKFGYPVGYCNSYPTDLKERIIAARMSYQMQIGLDYCLNRHVRRTLSIPNKTTSEGTIGDELTSHCLSTTSSALNLIAGSNSHRDHDAHFGLVLADGALVRCKYSLEKCFELANRGASFEALSVGRSILEQLAWCVAADCETDPDSVKKLRAESEFSRLKKVWPGAGRLYGYLSEHCHWSYRAHWRVFVHDLEPDTVIVTSVWFKIEALAALLALTEVFLSVAKRLHPECTELPTFSALDGLEKIINSAEDESELEECAENLERLIDIVKEN